MKTGIGSSLLSLAALSFLAGCQAVPSAETRETATRATTSRHTDRLLTIMTSPDAEVQMMSLVLTRAAQANGMRLRLMLCGPAGELALKTPPETALTPFRPSGRSPSNLLDGLIAGGATVEVCAIFLPARDLTEDALRDGVGIAAPASIAGEFASPETRVLSF
ncbi:MAG: hypothetical protein ACK4MQ_10420 [Hyphomonas sp.]